MEKTNPLRCRYCDKSFTLLSNKRRHEINLHLKLVQDDDLVGLQQHRPKTSILCTDCTTTYYSLNGYREHRKQVHGVEIKKMEYHFATQQEFEEWKDGLEKNVGVNFNLQRGPAKSYGFSKRIYYCRRSGVPVQKKLDETTGSSKKRKRCRKSQGSCKIGQFCTSSIEVIKRDGTDILQITYYPDHSNHELNYSNLVHMKLPKSNKDKIAVADFRKNVDNVQAHESDDPAEDIQMLQDIACSHNSAPEELLEKQRRKIDNLLFQLIVQCQNCSDLDALKSFTTFLAEGSRLLTAATKYPLSATSNSFPVDTNTIKEPANKKTVEQVRLYSTQKKKKKT